MRHEQAPRPDRTTTVGTPDVLTIKDLTVEFGVDKKWVPAVTDFNLTVRAGEIVALVGESGSGKSSTAMAALRLLPENSRVSGSVTLNGQELLGLDAKRMRKLRGPEMSVIFQEPMTALNPVFTIGAQITEALTLHREISAAKAKKRALELLELTEMANPEKVYDSYPHQLSGGQRQRAMIAQALCLDPKLLIADEPTTALDVTVQAEILDLMRNLQKDLGTTIILITHDMGVVADLAGCVVVMKDGRIVEQGPIDDIFYSPQAEYTQQLLEAVPSLGEAQARKKDPDGGLHATEPTKLRSKEEPILRLRDVCLEYPRQRKQETFRAVTGANFSIHEAETVGLVGESGSGKTTIGRAVTGLMPVAEGSLSVSGIELKGCTGKELKKVYSEVGMVFQDPSSSLNPRMPIGESVGEPLYMAKLPPLQVQQRVSEFLERIQIPKSYRNRYPHELSGGQKQRIGIARALILGPKLLVADEPTSALDVSVQAHILELMKELQEEFRFSCLFITHDLAVVDAVADRVIVMERGKIVEQGTREQILTNPREEYTRKLLSAVVVPDPRRQKARRQNLVGELITAS